jgi:hypothetical protein
MTSMKMTTLPRAVGMKGETKDGRKKTTDVVAWDC